MPPQKPRWPLWLILGWSLLVHLPGITSPLLDYHAHRQCQTASMSRNFARHGMNFFHPELDNYGPAVRAGTEFPLYSYAVAVGYKIFGIHEILGRLFSAGLTAWSALYFFWFIRRRMGETVALWSALVMCSIPIHIYFTRTFQPEPMAMWGFLGFIFHFDRWVVDRRRKDWLFAVLLGAIGPLLKLPYLYLVGGLWGLLTMDLYLKREEDAAPVSIQPVGWRSLAVTRARLKRLLPALCALGAIVLFTAAWYAWAQTAPAQVLPFGLDYHRDNLSAITTFRFWKSLFISRFPELLTTYSGLLLGLLGWRRVPRFFKAWWAVTFLYTLLCGEYGFIHKYTSLPWAPINAVFISAGLLSLWGPHFWRNVLATLLVIGIPVHSAFRIQHWYRLERLYLFDAKRVIDSIAAPDDLVFTNTDEHPVLLYYIDRFGYAGRINQMSQEQMTEALQKRVRFFLTPVDEVWKERPEWVAYFTRRGRLAHADVDYLIYEIL